MSERFRPSPTIIVAILAALSAPAAVAHAQSVEVLHALQGYSSAVGPRSALIEAADGHFYGTTWSGGLFNNGTIFRVTRAGVVTILHAFEQAVDGGYPEASLVQTADGSFYGTAGQGGAHAGGTVFRLAPDGTFSVVHAFGAIGDAAVPGALIQGTDGNFYGVAARTTDATTINFRGAVFRMTLDGTVAILHAFSGGTADGDSPAGLMQATDGNFYGATWFGGTAAGGTVFRMTPDGAVTLMHSFAGAPDGPPTAGLIEASDGNFYGTTRSGGVLGAGTVFRMTPSGTVTTMYAFAGGTDGYAPTTGVVEASDGNFYGTTEYGGAEGWGTVFRMSTAGAVTILHSTARCRDSASSFPTIVQSSDGSFFGTTQCGGLSDFGTLFTMDDVGLVAMLYQFSGSAEGAVAEGPLVEGTDGVLYGTTCYGGPSNAGTAFKLTLPYTFAVLYTFTRDADGACPQGLARGSDGHFYGTASSGGPLGRGTAFRLTPGGVFTLLHTFAGGADGASPEAGLVLASDGNFYGTTLAGGTANLGAVFRMAPDGVVSVLHAFAGGATDGASPRTTLVEGQDGSLYGTTSRAGGVGDRGAVFRITLSGSFSILHAFSNTADDGSATDSPLVAGADGYLYGSSRQFVFITPQQTYSCRLFFRVSTAGAFARVPAPESCSRFGEGFYTTLALGPDAALFGTSSGTLGLPSIFRLTPAGGFMALGVASAQEVTVTAPLLWAADGHLYGVTNAGGVYGGGTIFRLRLLTDLPSGVTVRTSYGLVHLTWKAVPGAASYTVKRATSSGAESLLAEGITTASYVDAAAVRGTTYYYIVTAVNQFGESAASYEVSAAAGRAMSGDFDGDGLTDLAVYRPTTGIWYIRHSRDQTAAAIPWGNSEDIPAPGDYNGDGVADVAVFRPSTGVWYIRDAGTGSMSTVPWGRMGDVAAPGDYDGDGITDVAVFRPSDGTWHIRNAVTGSDISHLWGAAADIPAHGDYDGDGRTDVAVFRPSTSTWYVRFSATGSAMSLPWGQPGDLPVPGDYDADGKTDIAVVGAGTWSIRRSSTLATQQVSWGGTGDTPVPGDYDGDGAIDVTVFQPTTGIWHILWSGAQTTASAAWGASADVPATGDYDGDGRADIAVFRPSGGDWYIRQSSSSAMMTIDYIFGDGLLATGDYDGDGRSDAAQFVPYFPFDNWRIRYSTTAAFTGFTWGANGDVPVAGDYDGDGRTDIAVFRPSTGIWYIRYASTGASTAILWGDRFDITVPADYDGDNRTDIAVFRPSTGEWFVRQSRTSTLVTVVWGGGADKPVPADYDGDGRTDIAVFRPSSGEWFVRQSATLTAVSLVWGAGADKPVPGDYDGDGKTDIAVFRPSSGEWFVRQSSTFTLVTLVWGDPSDIPVLQRP